MADRGGRLEDRPLRISAELFAYRPRMNEKRVNSILSWLDEKGFIKRYTASGLNLIQIINFSSHQNPHKKEPPSKYQPLSSASPGASPVPAPDQHAASPEPARLIPDSGFLIPDCGLLGQRPAIDVGDAWRDVDGCDAEAMQAWIKHRQIVKPPGLRGHEAIAAAKILRGIGEPAVQHAAVQTAIANGWNNLRVSDGQSERGRAVSATSTKSAREAADQQQLECLKESRAERGIPDFREPYRHESSDAYETALKLAQRDVRPATAIAGSVHALAVAKRMP